MAPATTEQDVFAPFVPRLVRSWPADRGHLSLDGTLVFVDISGFTALSERLARKGRVGAEEVASVLTLTFTELLTIADRLGGDLLKFGGDALLLLFTGDGHALRGVRAAAEMQRKLSSVGKVSTPAGTVKLRMSVGVHTGSIDFFLVGDAHRELIVTGPGATTTVLMEGTAVAGEILLSRAAANAIGDRFLGDTKGEGVLLGRMPPSQRWEQPAVADSPTDAESFVPVGLRRFVGSAAGEGEHRLLTVAFVKFTGTDGVLAEHGPEELHRRLDGLVTLTQQAALDTGVTFLASDIDVGGGKVILTAGAPIATGTDEERMLRAVRTIADGYDALPLKIGVNRGPAFSGDVGAPFRRTYTVIGDAVNLAARVMTRAESGTILATGDVLDRSGTLFDNTELEPFMVKGKSAPVRAWQVGEITGQRRRIDRGRLPLIGRDAELAAIEDALASLEGVGLVDVVGPAGIGKSRLIREVRARHESIGWHFSACEQYESSTPYYPFRRLLWSLLGVDVADGAPTTPAELVRRVRSLAPELAPWLPLLATVVNLPLEDTRQTAGLDPKFRTVKLHETVTALAAAAAGNGPFVMLLEDAHWMDDASRDLVAYLANSARASAWLLVLVRRPESDEPDRSGHVDLRIGPLASAGARSLAEQAVSGKPLLDHQIAAVVERAQGNPLFLLELVAAAEAGESELPDNIGALVLSRIDRLDADLRRVLRYSAAAGNTFDPEMITEAIGAELPAVGDEHTWQALGEFIIRRKNGKVRFRQAMFRDVAYEGLPFRTRRVLHQRYGETLERRAGAHADEQAALLGLHFFRAESYEPAWRYSVIAGDRAAGQYANNEAAELYTRALAAARHLADLPPTETFRVAEELGKVCTLAGTLAQADAALDQARRLAATNVDLARICNQKGVVRRHMGKYPQALSWLTRGRALLDGDTPDEATRRTLASLAVGYAGIRFRQGRYRDCVTWCKRALPDATASGDRPTLAHAYFLLDYAYDSLNELEGHETYWQDALAIYEELEDHVGQANVLNNQGVKAYYKGDWDRALDFYRRGETEREAAGDVVGGATAFNNIAEILVAQGDLDGAAEMLERARSTFRATNYQLGAVWTDANLGRVASLQGRHDDAFERLNRGFADLEAMKAEAFVLETGLRIAEAHLLAGDPAAALARADQTLGRIGAKPGTAVLRCGLRRAKGYAYLQQRNTHDALTELSAARNLAEAATAQYEIALTLAALGRWAETVGSSDAADFHEAADGIFGPLGVHTPFSVLVPEAGPAPTVTGRRSGAR